MQVKTKNLLVGVLVAVLVMFLWYRVAYSPAKTAASDAKSQTEITEQSTATLRKQLEQDTKRRAEKAEAIPRSKLVAALPVDDQITTFLRKTDEIARATGVTWQSVTPTVGASEGSVSVINVSIAVEGGYAEVMAYMRSMLGTARILVIDNVALTAGAGESGTAEGAPTGEVFAAPGSAPTMQAQIAGRLFTQPEVGATATPAAARASTKAP